MTQNELLIQEEPAPVLSMHPKKFALWLFILTVIMIFAAFTSAYIVRRAEGNWLQFNLPPSLWISTGILLASSVTMHWAWLAAKNDNVSQAKTGLSITMALGLLFTYIQVYVAWPWLVENNVYFAGRTANPAGSFVYVLTGVHVFHLISGLGFLAIVLWQAFRYKVHKKSLTSIEMCATYWHFLDLLWVYLFIFLTVTR